MNPCQYQSDIQDLKKVVFVGNGEPPLLKQVASISTKVDSLHQKIDSWDEKMGKLLDFKAGVEAVRDNKWESAKTYGVYIAIVVSILIAIFN